MMNWVPVLFWTLFSIRSWSTVVARLRLLRLKQHVVRRCYLFVYMQFIT